MKYNRKRYIFKNILTFNTTKITKTLKIFKNLLHNIRNNSRFVSRIQDELMSSVTIHVKYYYQSFFTT